MTDNFLSDNYERWRQTRFNFILSKLGKEYLSDKTLVEFGAGTGRLANLFVPLCKKVYAVEGREEHIILGRKLHPQVEFIQADMDKDFSHLSSFNFDIILHTGLLYHLSNLNDHISRLKEINCIMLILETVVVDSEHECISIRKEEGFDQSLSDIAVTPSPSHLERLISPYYLFERINDTSLDSYPHFYSASHFHNDGTCDFYHRGLWICHPLSRIILFDVGSMDGSEFYNIARNDPKLLVYAFEPTPSSVEKIKDKVKALNNFKVIQKAICEKDGTAEFHLAALQKTQGSSGNNSLSDFSEGWQTKFPNHEQYYGTVEKITVDTIRLDTFMKQNHIPYIDFLHIDAQGYDKEVLASLGDNKDKVREGVMEVSTNSDKMLYSHGISLVPALIWLSINGYEVAQVTPNDPPHITKTIEHNIRFTRGTPRIRLYKPRYTFPYYRI